MYGWNMRRHVPPILWDVGLLGYETFPGHFWDDGACLDSQTYQAVGARMVRMFTSFLGSRVWDMQEHFDADRFEARLRLHDRAAVARRRAEAERLAIRTFEQQPNVQAGLVRSDGSDEGVPVCADHLPVIAPLPVTAVNATTMWKCVAECLEGQASPYLRLRVALVELGEEWQREARLIFFRCAYQHWSVVPCSSRTVGIQLPKWGRAAYRAGGPIFVWCLLVV
jgi:hypothetical protein